MYKTHQNCTYNPQLSVTQINQERLAKSLSTTVNQVTIYIHNDYNLVTMETKRITEPNFKY